MEREMTALSRRQVLGGAAATAVAVTLGAPSVHAQKQERTIRFVPEGDLTILDPIWTTGYITRNHGYLVYDTLFGTDEHLQTKPQMVDRFTVSTDGMKYAFTLRDGLRWHDGKPVLSEDCVESLKRWDVGISSAGFSWPTRGSSYQSTRRRSRGRWRHPRSERNRIRSAVRHRVARGYSGGLRARACVLDLLGPRPRGRVHP